MAALINPCDVTVTTGSNTGIECDSALGVAKGIYIVPASYSWPKSDMADPVTFFRTRIHAAGSTRFYPVLTGIFDFAIANESDVSEANPITGISSRLRSGGFTLTYTYEKGGMCLAKALLSFHGKGYRFIAVDQNSQFLVRKNGDGTYSGLKSSDISSSITPATASAKFKNVLVLGVSQDEYIHYSELLKSDTDITDFNGLIDSQVVAVSGTTTVLHVTVSTDCAATDLVAEYGSTLAVLGNFIVKNKATGVVVTPTAISITAPSTINITGTYVTGQTYTVELSAPSVLLAAGIAGYEGVIKAEITI